VRLFGTTGTRVPLIGQGTWMMEAAPSEAVRALRRGIDLGLTHIDTAEMYGSGRVEEIVGEAIRGRRDEVFLVSKVLPSNATYEGTLRACARSLKRLGTDRLDVYLIHWWEDGPLEPAFRALQKLKSDGAIRAYGVSNFDVALLERCPPDIACNQVLYHLKERSIEHSVLPWCEKRRIAVVAYSPFGSGDFPDHPALHAPGATPRQAALAFLTRRTFAIPKSSRIDHVEENAQGIRLTEEQEREIDRAFPVGPPRPLAMI
jgi:diketogulonate reductase-like aldo/keto reductase